MAYALLVGNKAPEPRPEPTPIIRPDPIVTETNEQNPDILWDASTDVPIIGPITTASDVPESIDPPAGDQFSEPAKRAAAYKVNNAALKKTVD
ncbi:MAG: hypothetical protein LBU13_07940, partial [Synergistaceae bacterium]|nr:hypothetical protein [Synergistaceae bacterium]